MEDEIGLLVNLGFLYLYIREYEKAEIVFQNMNQNESKIFFKKKIYLLF